MLNAELDDALPRYLKERIFADGLWETAEARIVQALDMLEIGFYLLEERLAGNTHLDYVMPRVIEYSDRYIAENKLLADSPMFRGLYEGLRAAYDEAKSGG